MLWMSYVSLYKEVHNESAQTSGRNSTAIITINSQKSRISLGRIIKIRMSESVDLLRIFEVANTANSHFGLHTIRAVQSTASVHRYFSSWQIFQHGFKLFFAADALHWGVFSSEKWKKYLFNIKFSWPNSEAALVELRAEWPLMYTEGLQDFILQGSSLWTWSKAHWTQCESFYSFKWKVNQDLYGVKCVKLVFKYYHCD